MRAAVVTDVERPPVAGEFAEPDVPEGFVPLTVEASAVHQIVRAIAAGRNPTISAAPPFVPGLDAVGRLPDGTLVYAAGARPPFGTLAERTAVPAAAAIPLPAGFSVTTAAALVNPAYSAWQPLTEHLRAGSGQTVLVLGGTGVSGLLAVQLAQRLGAGRVIAAGLAGAGLTRAAELGADATVALGGDYPQRLIAAASDGVDLVLDYLWGEPAAGTFQALAQMARPPWQPVQFVQIGSVAGNSLKLDAALLRNQNLQISGNGLGTLDPGTRVAGIRALLEFAADGKLQIDTVVHPLSEVEQVWDTTGRLVLVP